MWEKEKLKNKEWDNNYTVAISSKKIKPTEQSA